MAGNNSEMVRLKSSTKIRLDQMKGKKSSDTFVDEMLTYFETLGITPGLRVVSPVVAVKEQASRVIEVVRGVEKTQTVILKSILDEVKKLSGTSRPQNLSSDFNPDEYIHINQVQELLIKSEGLERQNISLQEEVNRLKTEVEINARKTPDERTAINSKVILEIIEHLEGLKRDSRFDPDIYEYDRNTFDQWIGRLKSEISK